MPLRRCLLLFLLLIARQFPSLTAVRLRLPMSRITDPSTGVSFPLIQTFWDGVRERALGVGTRVKKVAFIPVKVYSVVLYVDEDAARADLQRAEQAGKLGTDEAVCSALAAGAYSKAFQIQLVRHVTGAQFSEAFEEALAPRMHGDTKQLEEFKLFFKDKSLDTGTNVALLWRQPDVLDLLISPPGAPVEDLSKAKADGSITSRNLVEGLWDNYLDPSTPAPEARQRWIAGARALLDEGAKL